MVFFEYLTECPESVKIHVENEGLESVTSETGSDKQKPVGERYDFDIGSSCGLDQQNIALQQIILRVVGCQREGPI